MTTIDKAAIARGVRARGGSVSDARRLLEMVATDDEMRRAEAKERRETELLAGDLGLSPDGLLEAVRGRQQ